MAGGSESDCSKPIDEVSAREMSESSGRERTSSLETDKPRRPRALVCVEGSMERRRMAEATLYSGGV
jgi:hypothetical protein